MSRPQASLRVAKAEDVLSDPNHGSTTRAFSVVLPLPPSANRLFANVPGKGRVKTRAYKAWKRNAILTIFAQVRADRRIGGPVGLSLCVPTGMRGDLDNRLKAAIDALVASNRIDDDKHVHSITILRGGADPGCVHVQVSPRPVSRSERDRGAA